MQDHRCVADAALDRAWVPLPCLCSLSSGLVLPSLQIELALLHNLYAQSPSDKAIVDGSEI